MGNRREGTGINNAGKGLHACTCSSGQGRGAGIGGRGPAKEQDASSCVRGPSSQNTPLHGEACGSDSTLKNLSQ